MYDTRPRKVDANTAQIVCNLAELAVRELEKKWALRVSAPEALLLHAFVLHQCPCQLECMPNGLSVVLAE